VTKRTVTKNGWFVNKADPGGRCSITKSESGSAGGKLQGGDTMGLARRACASHPPQGGGRRLDRMERLNHVVYGKTDEDRHHEVHKRKHGSWRQCPVCGAQARRKRWTRIGKMPGRHLAPDAQLLEWTLCAGYDRVRRRRIDGVLTLSGLAAAYRDELGHLVRNIAVEAWHDDSVHRILASRTEEDALILETTSLWLAETLGKAIRHRLGGDFDIRWSPGSDFARLHWQAPPEASRGPCRQCNGSARFRHVRT
jgi:hypothetical protein